MHLLIVEDDAALAESLRDGLEGVGYEVAVAGTAPDALRRLKETLFDLVLLDLELPGGDGLDILEKLHRKQKAVPAIIMTGGRTRTEDRVEGLDTGADDYLVKPFAFPELLARVRAVLRRAHGGAALAVKVHDLEIDLAAHRVARGGVEIELTRREYALLEYLVRHKDKLVTRGMLAADVWKEPGRATPLDNVIDVHISHLRRKLDQGRERKLIHTLRGKGFMFSGRA